MRYTLEKSCVIIQVDQQNSVEGISINDLIKANSFNTVRLVISRVTIIEIIEIGSRQSDNLKQKLVDSILKKDSSIGVQNVKDGLVLQLIQFKCHRF